MIDATYRSFVEKLLRKQFVCHVFGQLLFPKRRIFHTELISLICLDNSEF